MPIETLRAEKCDEDGNVPAYYYCNDWVNIKKSDKPLRIPAFGMSKESIEIYYIKPYTISAFTTITHLSIIKVVCNMQKLEEKVSNYHLNNIMNGLSPSMLINFNNGTPNQQERQLIETKIASEIFGNQQCWKIHFSF